MRRKSKSYWGYAPYVRVADRKVQAIKLVAKLKQQGQDVSPILIEGRLISTTFWGKAWCKHLEAYSDYKNRLPRGRTCVRNGSVIDLKVNAGTIKALVNGSSVYTVDVTIDPLPSSKWDTLIKECSGKIESLIELLQGTFSKGVMEIITHREKGLFPHPKEIKLNCSCPDWADMCKHVAAVLYGIGARLDERPEDLFLLRHVDHKALLVQARSATLDKALDPRTKTVTGDLSALFGIDIEDVPQTLNVTIKKKKIKEGSKIKPSPPSKKATASVKSSKEKTTAKKTTKPALKKKTIKRTAKIKKILERLKEGYEFSDD